MASETEASCESDPNFAIICAFMEKFGELCGIPSIDFVDLQQMLEDNQEVSPELMNLHIKLLRKTKKNVTTERWERALINMCHSFSSKDAWEIERFGYKKTRLPIRLRALKELLEMQFDFNTKFKNEVNKMTSEDLRSQPLGRDKLGRAYWFQTDNNYQIRIYKEDPDEETWNLIAKDRDGLVSLITELSDGDSKLSSDSACNEDSNSLLEKPLIDTGQNENLIENKLKEVEVVEKGYEKASSSISSNFELSSQTEAIKFDKSKNLNSPETASEEKAVISELKSGQKSVDELEQEEIVKSKEEEVTEVRRPLLRIKSLSELMEKPKEPPAPRLLPEFTITKKPKLDLPEITIVKKTKTQQPQRMRAPQVSSAIESPLMIIRGKGSGRENNCGNEALRKSGSFILFQGLAGECERENYCQNLAKDENELINEKGCEELFIGDEIEEPVMYVIGRGSGRDCLTGNGEEVTNEQKEDEKLACSLTSQEDIGEAAEEVPTTHASNIKLGTVIDSKTDSKSFVPRSPNKKSRWDQKQTQGLEVEDKNENNLSPKKMTFFFGPGSLNVKPNASLNCNLADKELDCSEKKLSYEPLDESGDKIIEVKESDKGEKNSKDNEVPEISGSVEKNESALNDGTVVENKHNYDFDNSEITSANCLIKEKSSFNTNVSTEEKGELSSSVNCVRELENAAADIKLDQEVQNNHPVLDVIDKEGKDDFVGNVIEENLQNDDYKNISPESTQYEIREKEELQNDATLICHNKHNVHIKENSDQSKVVLINMDKNFQQQEKKIISTEMKQVNLQHENDEKLHKVVDKSDAICKETKTGEIPELKSSKEQNLERGNANTSELTTLTISERLKENEIKEENDTRIEILESLPLNSNNCADNNPKMKDLENVGNITSPKCDFAPLPPNKKSIEPDLAQKESVDFSIDHSNVNNEHLSKCNEVQVEYKKAPSNDQLEAVKSSDSTVLFDDYPNKSLIDEELSENKKEEECAEEQGENISELSIAGQFSNSNKTNDTKMEIPTEEEMLKSEVNSDSKEIIQKTDDPSVEEGEKKVYITEGNFPDVEIKKNVQKTNDELFKQEKLAETCSEANDWRKEIESVELVMKGVDPHDEEMKSKASTDGVPVGKKRRGRNTTFDTTAIRPVRQTRQNRVAVVDAPLPVQTAKGRGRKKPVLKSTISDETGSNDSPIPLESVTVNDIDSNSAAAENTETDPLAVSDEDVSNREQPMSSITSFSFDYDPSSPVTQLPVVKKNLRKRGRECLENKPEAGETLGKRAKMKGKRSVHLTLRKSVEEKRQKEVIDVSSDENESVESPIKKKEAKKKKGGTLRKNSVTPSLSDSDNSSHKSTMKKTLSKNRNARLLKNLGVKEEDLSAIADSPAPVRQSRRLAQIKIKEDAAIRRKIEEDDLTTIKKKKKKVDDKDFKGGKRKRFEEEVKPAPTPPMVEKKKRKKKKHHKISIGWNTSSEDSENSAKEEEVSEYEYEEPHEEEPLQFKSDHEFSPESDLEGDVLPYKRARTARKEESDDGDAEEEFPCQKCGKSDHPEWILLCDKCDNGWHCSCLRPALFVIPEGDWFCPTCQHEKLVGKLNEKLVEFDKMLIKKEMEDRRKERLAYVGISLNNVLPAKDKKDKVYPKSSGSSVNASESESASASDSADASDSDEPIYQLRQRRQAHSYKFQDYDDLINSALQEEPPVPVEKTHTLGRGKDIATIVNAAKEEEERNAEKNGFEDLPPVVPKDVTDSKKKALSYRKKPKRLNNLEVNSDDEADDSDEDFKGSSSDESEDDFEEDSDDSFVGRKTSRPVRRSTRARTTRYDADFINDDSDDTGRKKKKKKFFSDDSESEQSDDWRGSKKKQRKISPHKKSKKKKKRFDDSDLETYRKKKPKIKYGMDSDGDVRGIRTRGKRTSYLDTLGSDSEEEALKKKSKDKSEDDEYVAEDDDKESEEEFDPELEKDSEEDRETREESKSNSESKISDSEEDSLAVKKSKIKKKRAIIDSEDEEESCTETPKKNASDKEVAKSHTDNVENPELNKSGKCNKSDEVKKTDQVVPKKIDEPVETKKGSPVKNDEIDKSQIIRELEKKALEKPPSVLVPILNVEKLKACGITLTKVSKDTLDSSLHREDAKSPSNLIEIGVKPVVSSLIQKNKNLVPLTVERIERNLEGLNDEEEMSCEERPDKPLPLTSTDMRVNFLKEQLGCAPSLDETKNFVKSPFSIMSNRKLGDNSLKKFRPGRFFNMRPEQEPMLGSSASLGMGNDDNDELSEPPGVALPLFSDIGSNSIHNVSKSSIMNRLPRNCTPPPMSHNRSFPCGTSGPGVPQLPSMNVPPVSSPYSTVLNTVSGINSQTRLQHPVCLGQTLAPSSVPNISTNSPISGPAPPNIPVAVNMPLVHRSATPPSSVSPEGTPKKRRGRGKGKKTLAAEAAAAAVSSGHPLTEPTKSSPNKSLAPNIEIASPPQPFSQSQPAPSVITRMLQTSPGKGAFPVGRIRPKQFAMMPDVDNENERSMESLGDPSHKDVPPTHPPRTAHPPGHYGAPVSSQYPSNYYQKEGHGPPHPYHHQRSVQPSMHSYPTHPTQTPNDPSSLNSPALSQPQINQSPINQTPINPPTINQSPLNPPPISQTPINLSASTPPPMPQYPNSSPAPKRPYDPMSHRPPYGSANSGYGYEYNAAAPPTTMNTDEVLHTTSYENPVAYPEQYDTSGSSLDQNTKNMEDEPSGEFGGLVSYFSSQHEDDLDT